jgi:hypothetical protein
MIKTKRETALREVFLRRNEQLNVLTHPIQLGHQESTEQRIFVSDIWQKQKEKQL